MTLSKLAKLANVSVSVVSKAFSGRDDVSEAMREHVFAVAKEHGCFNQFYHVPYDKPVISVIIPEVISQYYIHCMQCLKSYIEESGYTMLLSISNFDSQMVGELVRYYTEHSKVDAIVCFGNIPCTDTTLDTVLISINKRSEKNQHVTNVALNLSKGLGETIAFLKECGHKRIAYVGEPFTDGKLQTLKNSMLENGLVFDEKYAVCSHFRFEKAGKDGVEKLWSLENKPTAIIGAYGYITQGILSELGQRGILVPEDVSVVSLDNDPFPISTEIDVSCIPSNIEGVCQAVISLLNEKLSDRKTVLPKTVEIPTSFYVGNTVRSI